MAKKYRKVAFVATGQPKDLEMECRIKLHRKTRPRYWQTFEEVKDIVSVLKKMGNNFDYIVIDCLTLLISNLILAGYTQNLIEGKINKILATLREMKGRAIIVSNEVGLGIVPQNRLARNFRDTAGKINQIVAKEADEVFFMVSGIPWRIR